MMRILNTLFSLLLATSAFSQDLPPQMQFSSDGRMLLTGKAAPSGLYDSATIRTIELQFPQSNYWSQLTANYASKTDLPATLLVDGLVFDSVGVRFKGQTSYSMAGNTQKKSFNISLDLVNENQRLLGYKTLNLNNSFQDPSFLREVFYLHQIKNHIPAAKANFVQLYINGQNWGIYPNIQQLDKTYLKEWFFSNNGTSWRADSPAGTGGPGGPGGPGGGGPGWGDGTAALNYLGADTSLYKQYYTLKSSEQENPWDLLLNATNALNTTPIAELPTILPDYLDIDRTLWFLATEIAFTDDDSYVYKGKMDYYLYYEAETGRITPLEFDGNSAMLPNYASTWGPFYNANKVNYPLLNKMLSVPAWRQRYLAHLRTIIQEELDPTNCAAQLDHYQLMISSLVQQDPKKIYTFNQFNTEVNALKQFVNTRRTYLLNHPEVAQVGPTIQAADLHNTAGQAWGTILAGEQAFVTAAVSASSGLSAVNLYYSDQLTGNFSLITMQDDGLHQDGLAGDGLYGAALPAFPAATWVRFYVEAVAANAAQSVSYLPVGAEHDVFIYRVQPESAFGPVVINELMASNTQTVTDEEGVYEDWFELYNNSGQAVDLSGYFLTDNPDNLTKYQIPNGVSIPANGYLIFWADEDSADGPLHCNFRLSVSGEQLLLINPNQQVVDQVTFGAQVSDKGYARVPNGTGNFVIQNPTFNANNNNATSTGEASEGTAGFTIAPNPTSDLVRVQLDNQGYEYLPLQVRDLQGRILFQQAPTSDQLTVSTATWAAGIYLVQYGPSVKKLVVLAR
ncbi:MAG: CotH kinase family protein [Chitinophagales bacterium]